MKGYRSIPVETTTRSHYGRLCKEQFPFKVVDPVTSMNKSTRTLRELTESLKGMIRKSLQSFQTESYKYAE
ncbi:unnamed protein product [Orchesella dallaii]|uniref:Uncharacterized protein n=1 Tax=Orchesella dallaii TaxID=48710 RepID=A0ABP1QP38_9HEXA